MSNVWSLKAPDDFCTLCLIHLTEAEAIIAIVPQVFIFPLILIDDLFVFDCKIINLNILGMSYKWFAVYYVFALLSVIIYEIWYGAPQGSILDQSLF